jgi:hypothetical protein
MHVRSFAVRSAAGLAESVLLRAHRHAAVVTAAYYASRSAQNDWRIQQRRRRIALHVQRWRLPREENHRHRGWRAHRLRHRRANDPLRRQDRSARRHDPYRIARRRHELGPHADALPVARAGAAHSPCLHRDGGQRHAQDRHPGHAGTTRFHRTSGAPVPTVAAAARIRRPRVGPRPGAAGFRAVGGTAGNRRFRTQRSAPPRHGDCGE